MRKYVARDQKRYLLTAGTNINDQNLIILSHERAYITSVDMVFFSGTGTGNVTAALHDQGKEFGVSLINHVPLFGGTERGVGWTGKVPCRKGDLIRWLVREAVAADVIKVAYQLEIEVDD